MFAQRTEYVQGLSNISSSFLISYDATHQFPGILNIIGTFGLGCLLEKALFWIDLSHPDHELVLGRLLVSDIM